MQDAPEPVVGAKSPRRVLIGRLLAYAIGAALLAAAIVAASSRTQSFSHSFAAARASSPWLVLAAVALPLANIAMVSASFWVLTVRHGRVTLAEMHALILSSWLLNHLPLRPGLLGRLAYHRLANGIPVRKSVRIIVEQLLCGIVALVVMLAAAMATAPLGSSWVFGTLSAIGAACLVGALLLWRNSPDAGRGRAVSLYGAAVGFRIFDMTIWIARYLCVFAMVGQPIGVRDAAGIAAAAQGAMLSPIPLGLREWTVGLVHAMLGPGGAGTVTGQPGATVDALAPGIAADLVNRATELLVALPLGIVASLWLTRRLRAARQPTGAGPVGPYPPSARSI